MISDVRDGDPLKALRRKEVWSYLFLESLMAEYLFRFICLSPDPNETFNLSRSLSFLGLSAPLWYLLKFDVLLGKYGNEQAFRIWRQSCPWSYRESIVSNKNIFPLGSVISRLL